MGVLCVDIGATGATMFMLILEKFTRLFLNTLGSKTNHFKNANTGILTVGSQMIEPFKTGYFVRFWNAKIQDGVQKHSNFGTQPLLSTLV